MRAPVPGKRDRALIDGLVEHAEANEKPLRNLLQNLFNTFSADEQLMQNVHSMKWRIKDSDHLRDKLSRKWIEARRKGKRFTISRDNLFVKINDVAGFRIL